MWPFGVATAVVTVASGPLDRVPADRRYLGNPVVIPLFGPTE